MSLLFLEMYTSKHIKFILSMAAVLCHLGGSMSMLRYTRYLAGWLWTYKGVAIRIPYG